MDTKNLTEDLKERIKAQLERLLASSQFRNSGRMRRFLSYLVTETLAGRAEKLKGYTIGVDVFERDKGFDPQTDSIVRVEAARLRRLLHNYYLHPTEVDTVEITIPKGGYVPDFGDIRRPGSNGSAVSDSAMNGIGFPNPDILEMPQGPSIVVLPFDSLSDDSKHLALARGLTEEITIRLTQFSTLFVLSGHTAKRIQDGADPFHTACRALDVHYALSGSVRIEGDSVRVAAQLADTTKGVNVWAHSYDKELSSQGMIELQDEIGQSLTATIADPHGVIARNDMFKARQQEHIDLELYALVLHWFEYVRHYGRSERERLRSRARELADRYPDSSMVWTVRGSLALDGAELFDISPPAESSLKASLEFHKKAVFLDPRNSKAHQGLAVTLYFLGEVDSAFAAAETALSINPNDSENLGEYGLLRCVAGDWNYGLRLVRKAMQLNPFHASLLYVALCLDRYRIADDTAALVHAMKLDMPDAYWPNMLQVMIYGQLGESSAASAARVRLLEQVPDYEERADAELRRYIKEESLVVRCLEGLRKAGLNIS